MSITNQRMGLLVLVEVACNPILEEFYFGFGGEININQGTYV